MDHWLDYKRQFRFLARLQEINPERDRKLEVVTKTAADWSPAGCVKNEKASLLAVDTMSLIAVNRSRLQRDLPEARFTGLNLRST